VTDANGTKERLPRQRGSRLLLQIASPQFVNANRPFQMLLVISGLVPATAVLAMNGGFRTD
jgi:hypothetical protein